MKVERWWAEPPKEQDTKTMGILFNRKFNQLTISILIAAFGFVSVQAADVASECHKLYRLTDLSHAIEPGIPVAAGDGLPAHCRKCRV